MNNYFIFCSPFIVAEWKVIVIKKVEFSTPETWESHLKEFFQHEKFYDFQTEREKANTALNFSLENKAFQSRFFAVNALRLLN